MDPSHQLAHLRSCVSRLLTAQYRFLPKLQDIGEGTRPSPKVNKSSATRLLLLCFETSGTGRGRLVVVPDYHWVLRRCGKRCRRGTMYRRGKCELEKHGS